MSVIQESEVLNRNEWVDWIRHQDGDFGVSSEVVEAKITSEYEKCGIESLVGHLRFCGAIPEVYTHDSTQEKLYSKYTDVVIHQAYTSIGCDSIVLKERADVADVECVTNDYSFVADAKAFRLSRTAKNQKDFKIQAMDNWKHGKPFAMVVCPSYQLPSKSSQIYQQAGARSVCIATYSHLAVLSKYSEISSQSKALELLHEIFLSVDEMNPSKDSVEYWQIINRTMNRFDPKIKGIWREEKLATIESINHLKEEALGFMAQERERVMRLSKDEAIKEILKIRKIDNRERAISSVSDNGLLKVI